MIITSSIIMTQKLVPPFVPAPVALPLRFIPCFLKYMHLKLLFWQKSIHFLMKMLIRRFTRPSGNRPNYLKYFFYWICCIAFWVCTALSIFNYCKMATTKKSKKANQPLWLRVIKIIVIALCCIILLAAIAERIMHFCKHITK